MKFSAASVINALYKRLKTMNIDEFHLIQPRAILIKLMCICYLTKSAALLTLGNQIFAYENYTNVKRMNSSNW